LKFLVDLWKILQKAVPVFKKKVEKRYPVYSALRGLNLAPKDSSFGNIFFETVYQFEHNRVKHPSLINLFREQSAQKAFEADLTNYTEHCLLLDLQTNLAVKDKYADIRFANIDLVNEINEFIELFKTLVQQRRTPHDKEVIHRLQSIGEKLNLPSDMLDLSEHIKQLAKLREENKHDAVLTLLEEYKRNTWLTLSKDLKHKITVNIGITLFGLGRKKDAAKHFIELPDFGVKPEESAGLAALGYSLLENETLASEWAENALALNPKNTSAYLAKLFIKDVPITREEIDHLVPKQMQQEPVIAINIATSLENSGNHDEAFQIFSRLEQEYTEMDSFRCDILTQLAVNRIRSLSKKDNYFYDQLTESGRSKLNEALTHLSTVWNYFKHTDLNKSRAYVLANRGAVYKALGKRDEAEKDLLESVNLTKTYFAYSNLLELYNNNAEKTAAILHQLKELELSEEQGFDVALTEAVQHYQSGDVHTAISCLTANLPKIKDAAIRRKYTSLLVSLLLESQQYGEAQQYAQDFLTRHPDDPFGPFIYSTVLRRQGDSEKSEEYLQNAVSLCTEDTEHSVLWDISTALILKEDYKTAAKVLRYAADTETFSKLTERLITSEFHSGNFKEAHDLATNLLATYPLNPALTQIKMLTLEQTGRLEDAAQVIQQFLATNPDDTYFRVQLAMNLYNRSLYELGTKELDTIKNYEHIPPDQQFRIADAYIKGGEAAKALEIGYRLRMEHYGEEWVNQRYLQLQTTLVHLPHETWYPQAVSVDCYVALKTNTGKTLEYIIVDQPQHQLEVAAHEPLAQQLIGKQVGDKFERNNLVYEVTGIQWKYTHAVHESLDQIQNRFGNDGPIRVLEMEPGANPLEMLSQVFKPMKGGNAFTRSLDNLYMKGHSTIGANAQRLGVSTLKYWSRLVALPDLGIFSIGTRDELLSGIKSIEEHMPLVFDLTALLTLQQSGGFPILDHLKNDKYVPQSALDEIEAELQDVETRKHVEDLNIIETDGQFSRQIVTVPEKERIIENLTLLLQNIKNSIKPAQPPLPDNFTKKTEMDRVIGKSFNDALLITKHQNALLISDDAVFRAVGRNDFGVSGIPSLGLMQFLATNKALPLETVDRIHESLVRANYRQVPMRPELLLRIAEKDNFETSHAFNRACECFAPMIMSDEAAIAFVSKFFKLLTLQVKVSANRDAIVLSVLNILYKNRNKLKIKTLLVPYLEQQFLLLPLQKKEILDIVLYL
jgi:tetratricopeptide (TPR) repeat protein